MARSAATEPDRCWYICTGHVKKSETAFAAQPVHLMATVSNADSPSTSQVAPSGRSILRWLLYCWGICLELLGMAFMGAVVVVFFGQVDTRLLLSMTAVGMVLFYGGWFCVRQASRGTAKAAPERG
jgi:L-asparagine transporter-like permease